MRGLRQNVNNRLQPVEVDLIEGREHGGVEIEHSDRLVPFRRLHSQRQDDFGLRLAVTCWANISNRSRVPYVSCPFN